MPELPQNTVQEYVVPPGVQQVLVQAESEGQGARTSTTMILQVVPGQVFKLHISCQL
jgi:hypothetical protein